MHFLYILSQMRIKSVDYLFNPVFSKWTISKDLLNLGKTSFLFEEFRVAEKIELND